MLGASFPCCVATCVTFVLVPSLITWLALWSAGGRISPWAFLPLLATTGCAVGLFLKTSLTDPGVMPRRETEPRYPATLLGPRGNEQNSVQENAYTESRLGSEVAGQPDEREKRPPEPPKNSSWRAECENAVSREFAPQEPCPTCRTARPPGTAHCHDCGHCVVFLDHHCPWLGTCVGMRNYWWFLCALVAGAVHGGACAGYALWGAVSAASAFQKSSSGDSSSDSSSQSGVELLAAFVLAALTLAGLFCLAFCASMLGVHAGLLRRDETTRAKLRARPGAKRVLESGDTINLERTPGQRTQLARRLAGEDPTLRTLDVRPGGWTGLKRAYFGRKMPVLRGMAPRDAEETAWRWTVVLSGFGAD